MLKVSDPGTVSDEMSPKYRLDYRVARPNRFVHPLNPMPKPRRKPPRTLSLPRLVVPVGLSLILASSAVGFVFYTRITLYQQAHFAPESAHPWDGYAALCLFMAMAASALLLLNKRDPPPMHWRRGLIVRQQKKRAKRRRAGTIPLP